MNENLLDKEALDLLEFKTKVFIFLNILQKDLKEGDGTITELDAFNRIQEFLENVMI